MTVIIWSDKYSVGVPAFDDAHKQLASMINELQEVMSSGAGQDVIGGALEQLADYAARHFTEEVHVISEHNAPGIANHKLEHQRLLSQVMRVVKGVKSGNIGMSLDMAKFLGAWLVNHIQYSDKGYTPYLKDKPLQRFENLSSAERNAGRDAQPHVIESGQSEKSL